MHDAHSPEGVHPVSTTLWVAQSWTAQTGLSCTTFPFAPTAAEPDDDGELPLELLELQAIANPIEKIVTAAATEKRARLSMAKTMLPRAASAT
jgi:hypothetical protein